MRIRADILLVENGMVSSRHQARQLISDGLVMADGITVNKAAQLFPETQRFEISNAEKRWISRGGLKLAHAFECFSLPDITGFVCADIGASTGGFCDVLLHYGARRIYAVDVGHDQLAPQLASHSAIVNLEALNARALTSEHIPEPLDLVVSDVSFISVMKALPPALSLVRQGGHLVTLIKPQFEAGRAHIGKKGVVKNPEIHQQVINDISLFLSQSQHWQIVDVTSSPITGPQGNKEFLLYAIKT